MTCQANREVHSGDSPGCSPCIMAPDRRSCPTWGRAKPEAGHSSIVGLSNRTRGGALRRTHRRLLVCRPSQRPASAVPLASRRHQRDRGEAQPEPHAIRRPRATAQPGPPATVTRDQKPAHRPSKSRSKRRDLAGVRGLSSLGLYSLPRGAPRRKRPVLQEAPSGTLCQACSTIAATTESNALSAISTISASVRS